MANLIYKSIKVHYSSQGNGNAVVLLHGFLENITMWHEIIPHLTKKHRVICIDLLGHGLTGNLGYIHTMEEQAKMVKFILNHLKLRKYVFIGHSMGGYISLAFAELFPKNIKKLCLMNSSAQPDDDEKKVNRYRAIRAVKHSPKIFVKLAIPNLFSEANKTKFVVEIKQITQEALKTSPQGIIAAMEGMKIRNNRTFLLKTSNFPILMIISKLDPALEYQDLINQTKNTPVLIQEFLDGHMSHIENKNELIKTLIKFTN